MRFSKQKAISRTSRNMLTSFGLVTACAPLGQVTPFCKIDTQIQPSVQMASCKEYCCLLLLLEVHSEVRFVVVSLQHVMVGVEEVVLVPALKNNDGVEYIDFKLIVD